VNAGLFILIVVVAVFVYDMGRRRWQQNEWKRRWTRRHTDL
jgi:hypothetical protein